MNLPVLVVAMVIGCTISAGSNASVGCELRPCNTRETCDKAADWIVEGTFTLIGNNIWLEEAVLMRGEHPVPKGITYLVDASPSCYPVLPVNDLASTAKHLIGKRVRAYGSNGQVAYTSPGVIFLEIISMGP